MFDAEVRITAPASVVLRVKKWAIILIFSFLVSWTLLARCGARKSLLARAYLRFAVGGGVRLGLLQRCSGQVKHYPHGIARGLYIFCGFTMASSGTVIRLVADAAQSARDTARWALAVEEDPVIASVHH